MIIIHAVNYYNEVILKDEEIDETPTSVHI